MKRQQKIEREKAALGDSVLSPSAGDTRQEDIIRRIHAKERRKLEAVIKAKRARFASERPAETSDDIDGLLAARRLQKQSS